MKDKLPLRREFFPVWTHTSPRRRPYYLCGGALPQNQGPAAHHGGLFMNQPNHKEYKQKQNKESSTQNKAKTEPQNRKDEPQAR